MNLFDRISKQIPHGARVVLALSGGPDSVYLFHHFLQVRKEMELDFLCAHLHHGIREEADEDLAFVKRLCQENKVTLHYESHDVPKYAKDHKMSVEEAGRFLRYRLFYSLRGPEGYLALAHHIQDQAETLIMRLIRGTGIHGLGSMRQMEDRVFRPMLDIYKKDILAYLDERNLPYCIDQSNFTPIYLRNKIRLELMPYLREFNPNVDRALANLALQCQEAEDYLNKIARTYLANNLQKTAQGYKINRIDLCKEDPPIKSRIFRLFMSEVLGVKHNVSKQNIDDLMELCQKGTGKEIALVNGYICRTSYDLLRIEKEQEDLVLKDLALELGEQVFGTWTLTLKKLCEMDMDQAHRDSFIVLRSIKDLRVRTRQAGDYILLSKGGRKKVKDLFIDEKIDKKLRNTWPIVLQAEEILWIPGLYKSKGLETDGPFTQGYILQVKEKI